ncbi:hypothetical protein HYALB_00005945 [Hymenoscyphus albidus]|uniref:2EXR domain-containing protein n=1 Tax=Hymenoscyphus albidus TaxID=595503 RepID=A0A9N9Q1F5_9HELO|nr:hypothetical protein HYALB_00005945 [Hymenoscyphus albidus]
MVIVSLSTTVNSPQESQFNLKVLVLNIEPPAIHSPLKKSASSHPNNSPSTHQSHEALTMSSKATLFPLFSSLPSELRCKIWKAAAFPRVVCLDRIRHSHKCSRVWSQTDVDGPNYMAFFDMDSQPIEQQITQGPENYDHFASQSAPPLFLICKESHHVARQIYTKAFGSNYVTPTTWFSYDLDTLFLDLGPVFVDAEIQGFTFLSSDLDTDAGKVQNLAIYVGEYPDNGTQYNVSLDALRKFASARTVSLVVAICQDADRTTLELLEGWECEESTGYGLAETRNRPDPGGLHCAHPTFKNLFSRPNVRSWNMWKNMWESVWDETPYGAVAYTIGAENDGNWRRPTLVRLPLISTQLKADTLRQKQEYDTKRAAHKVRVEIKSEKDDTLVVVVPLLTTLRELASMFFQARNINGVERDSAEMYTDHESHSTVGFEQTVGNFVVYPETEFSIRVTAKGGTK